jgi:uncharacterized protein DUF6933
MLCIQCTRLLWGRLGPARVARARVPDRIFDGVALGSWTASMFRCGHRDVVIALDERTYATVLFALMPRRRFRANFALALGELLEDVHLPASVVAQECAALQFAPVARLDPGAPCDTLGHAQRLCELELFDGRDLRDVQLRVNAYPYIAGPASCAREALAEVFAPAMVRRGMPGTRSSSHR